MVKSKVVLPKCLFHVAPQIENINIYSNRTIGMVGLLKIGIYKHYTAI